MSKLMRAILLDLRTRRNVDLYAIAFVAFTFAALSVAGDLLSTNLRWTAVLGGLGLLVLRMALPQVAGTDTVNRLLSDRSAFVTEPLEERLADAHEVWVFAPSAVNFLSPQRCELLRDKVLNRPSGLLRVVVLDPAKEAAVLNATHQLDDSLDFPLQDFKSALESVVAQMKRMSVWPVAGTFEYGFLSYNPGFSLVAIDPMSNRGVVVIEFHAFHNISTASRMHITLTKADSEHWYSYWIGQFGQIWEKSSPGCG